MKRDDFLRSNLVKSFIDWISDRLDKPDSFIHVFDLKKPVKRWECSSIYSAFENYSWAFTYKDPLSGMKVTGSSFNDSLESLAKLSKGLINSIEVSNTEVCRNHCLSILDWGGVLRGNDKKIDTLGAGICSYLESTRSRFISDISSESYYNERVIMNSGFTKIYSLCMDDFIIYDGRVGAALGLLVRKYCEDNALNEVPVELVFAWGKGRESTYISSSQNKRNPGSVKYSFPELMYKNPERHTENNIRANWLLSEIVNNTNSKFNDLDKKVRMRALESALFMIGYKVV
ncbi:hypothetical protein [Paenibacillus abyssi]|uniref:Uncharacterized protein n=1 Tax=Paenibacillus abyssi TaxID=1340531 RepID=A0A917FU61_9BACL|nr:hypothetical protein [Paenibacillus abyssi]GGG05468.1 hypothetical protein GCM10010916_23170 [Paenibacillus abyssi]